MTYSTLLKANVVRGVIEKIGEATHLEFQGHSEWNYQIDKQGQDRLQLTVAAFDAETETLLKQWSDRLIKKVEVSRKGPNGQYTVTFHLASERIESFDYLTDDPSRLIIDFYTLTKTEPTQVVEREKALKAPAPAPNSYVKKGSGPTVAKKKSSQKEYTKLGTDRRPSGSEILEIVEDIKNAKKPMAGVYDGGDPNYARFLIRDYEIKEESIIASRQNIYIRFPRVKLKTSQLDEIKADPPEYIIKEKDTKENKEARFLQTLFQRKRQAAFIKTFEYFQKQYPDSVYDELLRNMLADIYYERWRETQSKFDKEKVSSTLQYLIEKYPDSVLTERSELILAYIDLENKDGVNTIQRILKFQQKYPDSTSRDQAYKALADGYLLVNKYEDALNVLENLEKEAIDKESAIEATYRVGDVHFQNEDYKKAIASYLRAMEKFPLHETKFANANYNLAEAYFWTGDFRKALEHYVQFVKLFSSHTHGAYALTRIGEVLDILGASKSKVMGAYLECTYRFKKSEGSEVARIRMLSQKMKNMKDKELRKALDEMNDIAEHSSLPRMEEFVTLMVADGLHRRGEYIKGLNYLISYYQRNPTSTDVIFFKKRILRNIGDHIRNHVDKQNFLEILNINNKYATTWLNNLDRYDIPYYVGRAYEMAGVFNEAQKIYDKTLSTLVKISGSREERERRVTEHLPYKEEVLVRLARTSYEQRQFENAGEFLSRIKEDRHLKDSYKIEKFELMALVAEQKGQIEEAKMHLRKLIEAWQSQPKLLASTFIHLASIEYTTKKHKEAEEYIAEIERLHKTEAPLDEDVWFKTLELKTKVLESQNRNVAAIEVYSQLLEEFEGRRPVAALRFQLGKLMFESGNIRGAEKVWNAINPDKNPMYVRLAKEKLNNAKWEDDYKRYINRIPAAETFNRSTE